MFNDVLSGGYCGGVPPLPIPNREVKPACADGTAMQCGRVGGRHFFLEAPCFSNETGCFSCQLSQARWSEGGLALWSDIGRVFWLIILLTTIVGVTLSFIYAPRTWCSFCPMGTISHWVAPQKAPLPISARGSASRTLCALPECERAGHKPDNQYITTLKPETAMSP